MNDDGTHVGLLVGVGLVATLAVGYAAGAITKALGGSNGLNATVAILASLAFAGLGLWALNRAEREEGSKDDLDEWSSG